MRLGGRSRPRKLELPMDLVFIAVGAGMFALFALYAVLLRRV
jgi:hypothetical protein